MGSAGDPDGGRGRDGAGDDVPETPGPADSGASDRGVDEGFYEEPDGGIPYTQDAGLEDPAYVGDTGGPVERFFPADPAAAMREAVVAREEERFGGIKIGSAFFGWFTATAIAVVLVAVVTAAGRAGFLAGTDLIAEAWQASTGGVAASITLVSIPFLAYFAGGYVAGRMARFNGVGQGLMVWLWTVILAAGVALLAIVGGGQPSVLAALNSLLRFPVGDGQLSTGGVIAAIAVAASALLGAVLGGIAGVHYHRKVDRAGFAPTEGYYHP